MHASTSRTPPAGTPERRPERLPGLSGDVWPVHPHRLDDELLSSWIVRTAHGNRIKLQTFTTLALGRGAALWNRDIDRSASEALLAELGRQTGSGVDDLRGGMLSGYEGILYEQHNPKGYCPWILPLGIYHRMRKDFGLQYCPLCLFGDPVAYFRRTWRLAFATMCDRHGNLLHDRCFTCGAPVVPFRNDLGRRKGYRLGDMVSCWRCGSDLRRAPAIAPSVPDGKTAMALRSLVALHGMGWWFGSGNAFPYGHQYFRVLHLMVSLLTKTIGRRMVRASMEETGWGVAIDRPFVRLHFEERSLAERHALVAAAVWLLDEWPDRFVRVARAAGVRQSGVIRGASLPYWFEDSVRARLGAGLIVPTAEEANQAAALLARRGIRVSARAIGRLIGRPDSVAAKVRARKPVADSDSVASRPT